MPLPGIKKALAAAAMILARASEADRHMTLKRIKSKAVDVTDQRLIDQVIPPDPFIARPTTDAFLVRVRVLKLLVFWRL